MTGCKLCPRRCGADRETKMGRCQSGRVMRIARAALHHWEEPPLSGEKGSGAVFFTGCGLGCAYCQNGEISRMENPGEAVGPEELNRVFFDLISQGAHNINLVTAGHFVPQVCEALRIRRPTVPVVYNSSGYERVETLRLLEGLVDIYLPDFKYGDSGLAGELSRAEDYPETALKAIKEMVRQAGPPVYGEDGLMKRGVLIRHLILPGHTKNSIQALRQIAENFPSIPVSLMAQYTPQRPVPGHPELSRGITRRELDKVQAYLFDLGLDGFVQSRSAKGAGYIPDFQQYARKRANPQKSK